MFSLKRLKRFGRGLVAGCCCLLSGLTEADVSDPEPILVGINADMTTVDAESGVAIQRGAQVALAEINAAGGVLGRPLQLRVLNHRRNPARGIANIERFAADPQVVAVLGGKHTPVVLAELPQVHAAGLPYLIPWAAGTPIIDNGYEPNYVFRLSVRDADAGAFLLSHARQLGFDQVGLLLEQTGWGRSNGDALEAAAEASGSRITHTEWFNWGQRDFAPALTRLRESGAAVILFVGNAPDGVTLVKAMLDLPEDERLPVVSHWGIAGGRIHRAAGRSPGWAPAFCLADLLLLRSARAGAHGVKRQRSNSCSTGRGSTLPHRSLSKASTKGPSRYRFHRRICRFSSRVRIPRNMPWPWSPIRVTQSF